MALNYIILTARYPNAPYASIGGNRFFSLYGLRSLLPG